jgi:hypothetical protein
MAESLISMSLLEIISNGSAGNATNPANSHFQIFQGHFHGHEHDFEGAADVKLK